MAPIRKGDGTPIVPKGIQQVRTGDGRVLFDGDAIPDSVGEPDNWYTFADDDSASTLEDSGFSSDNLMDGTIVEASYVDDSLLGRTVMDFSGSGDYVEFTDNNWPNFSAFTVGATVRVATETDFQNIWAPRASNEVNLYAANSDGNISLFSKTGTTTYEAVGPAISGYIGDWITIVARFTGSEIILYVNGTQEASNSANTPDNRGTDDVIASGEGPPSLVLDGRLADFEVHYSDQGDTYAADYHNEKL